MSSSSLKMYSIRVWEKDSIVGNRFSSKVSLVYPPFITFPPEALDLRPEKDVKDQYYHRDFNHVDSPRWGCKFPVSVLVAFERGSTIRVWQDDLIGSSDTIKLKEEEDRKLLLSIKPGEALIFHALLIYSGCAYKRVNVRAHCYGIQDWILSPLPLNEVTLVVEGEY